MKKILPLFLIAMISGCAFGTRRPLLEYNPIIRTSPEPRNVTVYVENFKDERADKSIIGNVRNGWGIKTADVVTDSNVAEWITGALKAEFGNYGYVVAKDRTELQAGGEVLTVYCDSFMQYEGEVRLGVVLKKNNEILLDKKYTGRASNMNWAATAKSYAKTLEQSLQNAMSQIMSDINEKLGQETPASSSTVKPVGEQMATALSEQQAAELPKAGQFASKK